MAALVPSWAPRPGANAQKPPPNFNLNYQTNPNSLADNMQNLNLNRPLSMPNSSPRPSPFGQQPSFLQSAVSAGYPVASPPISRPVAPPSLVGRPAVPLMGPPQSTLPVNVPPRRPLGPLASRPSPFGSRPPPASISSSTGGAVLPSGAFPSSGVSSVAVAPPPLGARPSPFVSSSLVIGGPAVPLSNVPGGPLSNGPPGSGSRGLPGAPRFPSASILQPSVGPLPTMLSARAPTRAPTTHSVLGTAPTSSPVALPMPSASTFSTVPQARPPPLSSPYKPQTWPAKS